MLFSSTNFGEQYFLYVAYYRLLTKYVKRKIFHHLHFRFTSTFVLIDHTLHLFLYMSPQLFISLFQNAGNPSNVSSPHPR